jgi:DNA-binding response OmpR family regulator
VCLRDGAGRFATSAGGRQPGTCALGDLHRDRAEPIAEDPERVFKKEELLRNVWGFRSLGRTRTLDSHASRLRRKLNHSSESRR